MARIAGRSGRSLSDSDSDARLLDEEAKAAAHYRKMYDRTSMLAKIGVWECDLATEELTWTDAVYDLFDLARGSKVARADIVTCYEAESRREMERLRAAAIRNGTGFTLDIRIRTAKGNKRWIRLTAEIEQEDGRSVRIFGTKQDISEEKEQQERVQALQAELLYVSRVSAMRTMASMLAHELNQPLTAISSFMGAAQRIGAQRKIAADLSECIGGAAQSAQRAGEIIRRLRDMTVKGRIEKSDLDIALVAREAAALATAGYPGALIEYDIDRSVLLRADRVQIQQVLINLIRNACDAADGGYCELRIGTTRKDGYVEIRVSDNGPGISEKILPHIFQSLITTKQGGMGIGLSICRTIIEAHGGHIGARNNPDRGASVYFTLPLSP